MTWQATGVTHAESCGCVHKQEQESGGEYHERWMPFEQCAAHARRCPDTGRCWHNCGESLCWRVANCGPLSAAFPGDEWPLELRR